MTRKFLVDSCRTLIKFNILLGEGALQCYKYSKEGLGTQAPTCETLFRWVMFLAVEPQQQWQMNATWKKWNLSLNVCTVFCVWHLLQNDSLSSKCLPYPDQQPGETKSLCKVVSMHAQHCPKSHACSHYHPRAVLEKLRQCIPQSHFNGWRVTDAFIRRSAEITECILAHSSITKEEKHTVLRKSCMSCSSAKMGLCLTIPC
jgi:hypothetical protein